MPPNENTASAADHPERTPISTTDSEIEISKMTTSAESSSSTPEMQTSRFTQRKQTPSERLQRSRERNRMHARKTRQRKKEHMQNLQGRADELKEEQIRLRQTINEKNTASILVGLFSINEQKPNAVEDPTIENLLRRPTEEIPDSSRIPELPALILPGQHNSKRLKSSVVSPEKGPVTSENTQLPDDGIDYELLGKDRSKCTPAELDQIRRERNRMHAKRTRDRKRLFMEEMEEIIKKLEQENALLQKHLENLGGDDSLGTSVPQTVSRSTIEDEEAERKGKGEQRSVGDQINSLLAAAGAFEQLADGTAPSSEATAVSASTACSCSDQEQEESLSAPHVKRRRLEESGVDTVPISITTAGPTAVDC